MANFSSSNAALVIDTSVAINLAACGIGGRLLAANRRTIIVPGIVAGELEDAGERGQVVLAALDQWRRDGLLTIEALPEPGFEGFEELISGSTADTIDDGEAATIIHAEHISGTAVIDDGKANRIASARYANLQRASTVDLMMNDLVRDAMKAAEIADALFMALTQARTRVMNHHLDAVVQVLGPERVALCRSLRRSTREASQS